MPQAVMDAISDAVSVVSDVVKEAAPILPLVANVVGGPWAALATALVVSAVFSPAQKKPAAATMNGSSGVDAGPSSQQQAAQLVSVRQAAAPWQTIYGQSRVGGIITYIEATPSPADGSENAYLHLVITLAGHECQEIGTVYFDDQALTIGADGSVTAPAQYAGFAQIIKDTGFVNGTGQPFPGLVSQSAGVWTDAHRQTGRAKIWVRLTASADAFPRGIPNISAVVKGKKVYDPRTGLTVYSANAALCVDDYLCDSIVGVGAVYASEIHSAQLISSANVCDEAVALAAGGTEARYELHGAFDVGGAPKDILEKLLTAMHGKVAYISGEWWILAAAYSTPTETLTVDELRGPVHIQPRLSKRDLCNRVKGTYVSSENNWQPSDFPPVTNATYLSEDQGEEIWLDIDLPFTKSAACAQRIAKIALETVRQQVTLQLQCKLSAWRVQPGDVVLVTLARYGYTAKPFEVIESSLVSEDDGAGGTLLGVDLTLRETASAVFDWNSGLETRVDPAPDSSLPDGFSEAGVPGTPSVVEALYETTGSAGLKTKASVAWLAAADQFVQQGGFYELEWQLNGATAWTRISPITALAFDVLDLAPGIYNFRLRATNSLGVHSAYTPTVTKTLYGLTAAPANVTNFSVRVISGQAMAVLDQSTDLDVRIGGRLFLRWCDSGVVSPSWQNGSLLSAEGWPGDSVAVFAPLPGSGTFFAKFRDSSGNYSTTEASFTLTDAAMTGFSTLVTATEDPSFAGAKVNTANVGGGVQLVGATLWDDLGAIDGLDEIDSLGGIVSDGSYAFSNEIDLGSVLTVKLFPTLRSLAFDTADKIDSYLDMIDDWGMIDGTAIEDAEVDLQVRWSNDHSTWSAWHALPGQADYTARYFQFRVLFASASVNHNRKVTALSVAAKQPL